MINADRLGALLLLAFAVSYTLLIQNIAIIAGTGSSFNARSMPIFLACMTIPLCIWLLIRPTNSKSLEISGLNWQLFAAVCALMSLYGLTIRPLGFLLSTGCFLTCSFYLLGERRHWLVMLVATTATITFWLLMSQGLGVFIPPLPQVLNP